MLADAPASRRVDIGALQVYYNHPHDLAAILEVFVLDVYSHRLLKRGDVVLDVGAGVGEFTMLASQSVGPSGLVISVEPNPRDFQTLTTNLSTNRIQNVVAINSAVGSGGKLVELSFKGVSFRSVCRPIPDILESVAKKQGRARLRVDFVKMDIEGAEVEVLQSMHELLPGVRVIALELHQTKPMVDEVLKPMAFRFRPIDRQRYLMRSLRFAFGHPRQTLALVRLARSNGEFPGVRKILGGIEISKGTELLVGLYTRGSQ